MATYRQKLIVKHSVVFGHELEDTSELLRSLDKSTAVKIIARLNHLARTQVGVSVDDVLNMWFGTSNQEFRVQVRGQIISGYLAKQTRLETLNIISMWSNLKLLDLILADNEEPKAEKSAEESERDFFKVYLSVNEEFGKGSDQLANQIEGEKKDFVGWYARQMMATLIKYHDFAHLNFNQVVATQLIKSYYCFRFLVSNGHQALMHLVLRAYGVGSWQEYFQLILPICYDPIIKGDGSGLFYFQLQGSVNLPQRRQFIQQLALDGSQGYPVSPDFLHVRAKPLYETEPNRFLVTDTILTNNRVHNSLFWELKSIATGNQHLHPRYNNFFSFFTTEYVEKYLAYTLLDELYCKTTYYRLSGEQIKKKFHITLEPDYYVRNGKKVFLYEVKGSVLTGAAKQSFNYSELEAELRLKYYQDPKTNKRIGILQLVDRIKVLVSKEKQVPYDLAAKRDSIRIYPILLITERALTTPGMNMIFNQWFQHAIINDPDLSSNLHQIQPLTIIDVDTLINFMELLKGKPSILEHAITDYHQLIKKRMPTPSNKKTREQVERNLNLCLQSFPEYIESNYKSPQPGLFMQIAKELIAEAEKTNRV